MKKLSMIVVVALLVASASYADKISWGSGFTGPNSGAIVDHNNVAINLGAGSYTITMYNLTQGMSTLITTDFGTVGTGYFYRDIQWPTASNPYNIAIGNTVYTRVDSLVEPGWYLIVPGSQQVVGDYTVPPGTGWAYNIDGCLDTDWVLVPEPGVIGLFALGMITLGVAKIRRKK